MKYPIANEVIPQEKRKEINEKILYLIEQNKCVEFGITKEDIFNGYTGNGGLHGLEFKDFSNFHEFTEAKKLEEVGQFFTSEIISQFLVDCIKPSEHDLVADLTFGKGSFFNFLPTEANVYGTELDNKAYKVAKFLYPEANIKNDDIRYYDTKEKMDVILGNPPFNLRWEYEGESYLSQYFYCKKSEQLLKPGGLMALIVPVSFLNDEYTDINMMKEIDSLFNFVCQFKLPRNAFKFLGVTNFETKIMIFQKKSKHLEERNYELSYIEGIQVCKEDSDEVYKRYVHPLFQQKEKVKAKVFLEAVKDKTKSKDFDFKVKKMLFDIKRNPKLKDRYGKAEAYVERFLTQEKPEDMDWEQWYQERLTESKVLSYLKRIVKNQHHVEKDEIKLVKTRFGLKLKAYSHKTKLQLSNIKNTHYESFNNMILDEDYPFEDQAYKRLFSRKLKQYRHNNQLIKMMPEDGKIKEWLEDFALENSKNGKVIKLNDIQKEDLHNHFQKRYSILNWEQGSGKTVAGIAWYRFIMEHTKTRNVFVVAPALAINLTWVARLRDYKEDFIKINSLKDIDSIKNGQIVLITFDMLVKYQKQLKHFIKKQNQKVGLIVDESDELTNYTSKRTRASLNVFKRVKYKLLTTGTTTRNTLNELYPQIELLFNNSINMLCECPTKHKYDKDRNLEEKDNEYYMCPFPAHYGQTLFKQCFSPSKATVFGIKKDDQNIYNSEALKHLIGKTITTRKFKEVAGEKKYEIFNHRVPQNPHEKLVYSKIIKEFGQMMHYFNSTGNARKDTMLKIIRQLQLLIKSTSIPQNFKEYITNEMPNKYLKIRDLVAEFQGGKVAIGTVFVKSAISYFNYIKEQFPQRKVFLIRGEIAFNKRDEIIKEFEATKDGILISTQQSLKSSVNIPSCNRVIIESLQYNVPKISQYYFRFIRFDSEKDTDVHFVTLENSIEQNLFALLMAKERINDFIKTQEYKEQGDIFEEFGLDLDILNEIIEKQKDEEGRVKLTWGQQRVS